MNKYVLDSDTIIYFLKGESSVVERVVAQAANQLFTTIVNYSELCYGVHYSANPQVNLKRLNKLMSNMQVLTMEHKSADLFGQFKARLRRDGILIADMDLLIASIVSAHDYTLVTNNTRHFNKIASLKLENWYAP